MTDRASLRIEREGAIATIVLNRPERRNAADRAMIGELGAAVEALSADTGVRAIILTGADTSFCAGWDRGAIAAMAGADAASLEAMFADNEADLARLRGCRRPTIALVNGPVAGFGMSLVAACDFAIAADSATFHLPEAALGLVPAVVAGDMLRVMGARRAFDWLALADRRDPEAARQAGLVRAVVPADALTEAGMALAQTLAAVPGDTLATLKAMLARLADAPAEDWPSLTVGGAVAALQRVAQATNNKNENKSMERDHAREGSDERTVRA